METSLTSLLGIAGARVGASVREQVEDFGLTLSMWRVLEVLSAVGDQTFKDLARSAYVEQSTLSRQVAVMSDKGLIVRRKSDSDWRSTELSLTDDGPALVRDLSLVVADRERQALKEVDSDDLGRLRIMLGSICGNVGDRA